MRVLMVDDNDDHRLIISIHLRAAGASVDLATTGAEAIERARMQRYDVILMDLEMPALGGYEAVQELRCTHHYRGPIVAFTAHAMESDRHRCLSEGFSGFISKPIAAAALIQRLAEYLHSSASSI